MSMKYGAVPKEWKRARVIPLYKDGKCDEAINYRPISVLPIISKIMERIVHDQLYKFIEENNILNKCLDNHLYLFKQWQWKVFQQCVQHQRHHEQYAWFE